MILPALSPRTLHKRSSQKSKHFGAVRDPGPLCRGIAIWFSRIVEGRSLAILSTEKNIALLTGCHAGRQG